MTAEEQLQVDVFALLLADPVLATVVILSEQLGVKDSDLDSALKTNTNFRAGSIKGAAIVVGMPFRKVPDGDAPGPRIDLEIVINCVERPLVNRYPGGNGFTAEFLSNRVEQLLHFYVAQAPLYLTLASDGADPVSYKTGERAYENHIKTSIQLLPLCKPAKPKITGTPDAVLITCSSPGAIMFYTIDGSFPYAGNPNAIVLTAIELDNGVPLRDDEGNLLISEPMAFAVPSGTLVRAASFFASPKPNQSPSDLAGKIIK